MASISTFIRALFSGGPIYARIQPNKLSVRDVSSGKYYEDIPCIAIKSQGEYKTVAAIGKAAKLKYRNPPENVVVINAFEHPRLIINDFSLAETTLKLFLKKIQDNKIIRPSPVLIMHVTESLEGGLSQIEIRALRELALGANASTVHIWQGRELSDQEILEEKYLENTD